MEKSHVQIMAAHIHVAARTASWLNQHPPTRFEECAGCHRYQRLIQVGKLWIQSEHDCDGD